MQRMSWCDGFLPKAASKPAVRTQPTILAVPHVSSMHSAPGWCLRASRCGTWLSMLRRSIRSFVVSAGTGGRFDPGATSAHPQGMELTKEFLESPLRGTIEHGVTLRRGLDAGPSEFSLLDEFRANGCTEYLAVALNRMNRRHPVVAWATDRAGGFTEAHTTLLEQIRPALAAVIEMLTTLRTARGLFSTYLDHDVGKRLINGQLKRGHAEPIHAVMMATDLRNFTSLSDRLPSKQVIGILDDYFEVVGSAVHAHGGNVLKFMGDGVLAVFRANSAQDGTVARAALAAARISSRNLPLTSAAKVSALASDCISVRPCTAMLDQQWFSSASP